jgi:hypothetical protein
LPERIRIDAEDADREWIRKDASLLEDLVCRAVRGRAKRGSTGLTRLHLAVIASLTSA